MPLIPTAEAVISELHRVFPAKRPDLEGPLSDSTMLDEEVVGLKEAFADKDDWTVIDPEWLVRQPDNYSSAMGFLSDEAICFYIPAFIKADLLGITGETLCQPEFQLTHGLDEESRNRPIWNQNEWPDCTDRWLDHAVTRWRRLSQAQCGAVVQYLEWKKSDDEFAASSIQQALDFFWYSRAGISTH